MNGLKGWFDSPIESFRNTYNQGVAAWQAALAALDEAYNEFIANRDYAMQDPELSAQYDTVDGHVSALQATITNVRDALTSIENFFSNVGQAVGLSGRQAMKGLGVLPAIPWALVGLVTAGTAGVWVIIREVRAFNVTVANKRIADYNMSNPSAPVPYINLDPPDGGGSGSIISDMSGLIKWGVIGLIAFTLLNHLPKENHGN